MAEMVAAAAADLVAMEGWAEEAVEAVMVAVATEAVVAKEAAAVEAGWEAG